MRHYIIALDNPFYWDGFKQYLGKDAEIVCHPSKAVLLSLAQAKEIVESRSINFPVGTQPYIVDMAKFSDYTSSWKETYTTYVRLGFDRLTAANVATVSSRITCPYKVTSEGKLYV